MLGPSMRMSRASLRMQQLGILVRDKFGQGLVAAGCAHVALARGGHGATQGLVNEQTAYGLRKVVWRKRHAQATASLAQQVLLVGVVAGDDRDTQGQVLYDLGRRAGVEKRPSWIGSQADLRGAHVAPRLL